MNEYKDNSLVILRNRRIEYNYFTGCCIVECAIKSTVILILIKKMSNDKFSQTWKCFYNANFVNVIFNENFSDSKSYEKNSI